MEITKKERSWENAGGGKLIGYQEVFRLINNKMLIVIDPDDQGDIYLPTIAVKVTCCPNDSKKLILGVDLSGMRKDEATFVSQCQDYIKAHDDSVPLITGKRFDEANEGYPGDVVAHLDKVIRVLNGKRRTFLARQQALLKEYHQPGHDPEVDMILSNTFSGGIPADPKSHDVQQYRRLVETGVERQYKELKAKNEAFRRKFKKGVGPHPGSVIPEGKEYDNVRLYLSLKRKVGKLAAASVKSPIVSIVTGPPTFVIDPGPATTVPDPPPGMLNVLTTEAYFELSGMVDVPLDVFFNDLQKLARLRMYHGILCNNADGTTETEKYLQWLIEKRFDEDGRCQL